MFRANISILLDFMIIVGLMVIIGLGTNLATPEQAGAGPPKEKPIPQVSTKDPSATVQPGKRPQPKKKGSARVNESPTQQQGSGPGSQGPVSTKQHQTPRTQPSGPGTKHPALSTQHSGRTTPHTPKATKRASGAPATKYHGTFVEALRSAPFPYSGKDTDPDFFDFVDPKTGERFRTTRTLERLSEKGHYRDNSVLFHVPGQFNPRKPFTYVVFFHGNRTEVRQFIKDYRLDEQIERSGTNVILVLPQLAKNAADSSPGNFLKKNAFRTFMHEAAQVLMSRLGKQYQKQLEQAPIILAAFSGGYKPLACTLDRGGSGSRTKGVLLLDALYEDLYIFGRWILNHASAGFFINIFTEESSCEEKTKTLAQFLREHHVPFKNEWPKVLKRGNICLIRSPHSHLQVPLAGPPKEPLAEMLRRLKN